MSWYILEIVFLCILLFLSGFFSGSETALIKMGQVRVKSMQKRGVKGANIVQKLVSEPEVMLTTVLIGNNIVNIAASALATSIAIRFFGDLGVGIAIGIMTFFILIFGEIIPKTFAVHHSERFSIAVSKPLKVLIFVLRPVVKLLLLMPYTFGKLLGLKVQQRRLLSEEEVKTVLDIGAEDGAIDDEEKKMMTGVLKLDHITVKNVMTPKKAIACIGANQSIDSVVKLIKKQGYSRIPVYEGRADNIVGILYSKDLLINSSLAKPTPSPLKKLMKPAHFVRETARVDDLLKEFREGKFHIAIVVDKEGRTKGLVSLEDLLEVIVGSIYDEHDMRRPEG
ncbi:MAG: DUF21 domain-containing protein [Methanophagales archaeon]|nr:DUF21 domain-containing protein [Methanophagales archaeon]